MKPLTSIHHTIRILCLLGLLVICNISFNGCSGSNESFTPTPNNKPTKSLDIPEPALFIETPERLVGGEEIKFTLMRTEKIPLQELNIHLASSNSATFQLIKKNGESGGTDAKLSEVTDYNGRFQEDTTLPIKMKLDQDNGEKEATITITVQQAKKVLVKKNIHWVKDGININVRANSLIANDDSEVTLALTNIGNKPVDLKQVIIDGKCTDFGMNFMLENVSTEEANTTLGQVTGLGELGSGLNTQLTIRPCTTLQDQVAVGVKVTLSEKQDDNKKTQVITSIPLVFYNHKISQIKKQIYQLIGDHGDKLDSLQNSLSYEPGWLIACKAKLKEGVAMYKQLLSEFTAIQKSDAAFTPLISNLSYDHSRQMKKWKTDIKKIKLIQQGKPIEEISKRSTELQQELEKIPTIIQEQTKTVKNATNVKDITTTLLADYNRELPIEQQSIDGLHNYAKYITKELDTIKKSLNQQSRTMDVNPAKITDQVKAIERQAQSSLKGGFEKYKSTLSQQQDAPSSQPDLKEQKTRNQLASQLELQASTLDTWTKYIRDKQDENNIEEDTLYIVQAYEKIAKQALILAKAYFKDPNYQAGIHKCADLVAPIVREVDFLAQVYNNTTMQTSAINICRAAIGICKLLGKLPQTKALPQDHHVRWLGEIYQVTPTELAKVSKILQQYRQK